MRQRTGARCLLRALVGYPAAMRIILKWLLSAVALLAVAYLYSGVQVNSGVFSFGGR